MICESCGTAGPVSLFSSEDGDTGFVCPVCGMDESGLDFLPHRREKKLGKLLRKIAGG